MSREIKFEYLFENIQEDGRSIVSQIWTLDEIEKNEVDYDKSCIIARRQFTGLTDINNVEIFEGDIVRLIDNDDYTDCYIVKYFGDKGYPAFDIDGWDNSECNGLSECTACFKLQIIGNIHDNPELLEVSLHE